MTSCLSILRFGSPQHAGRTGDVSSSASSLPCQRLTDRLMEHFASLQEDESSETNHQSSSVLHISNRYFAARVALRRLADDETHPTTNDPPYKEDGIVLVWYEDHIQTPDDFTQLLNSVHDQLEAAGGGDLLRLCVAVESSTTTTQTTKTPKQVEEEYSQRVLWCLDRGYEYIPACDLSDEGIRRGHGERDKEGFARLVEAIQGTVWSSAVMATSTRQTLKSAYQQTIVAVEQSDENNENDDVCRLNQYVPPDPTMLQTSMNKEVDAAREKKAQEALMKEVDEQFTVQGNADKNQVAAHPEADLPNERLLNQFEGAMQEASRIRDLSRSGELSDEERRQRAGDAAMMLVNLLDQMGYDDEDEDEDSSDGDEVKEEKVD